jgi:hypothetical protein
MGGNAGKEEKGLGQNDAQGLCASNQLVTPRSTLSPWRRRVPLDLFADGLHGRRVRAKEAVRQRPVLAQQPDQQLFGLDIRTAEKVWSGRFRPRETLGP